MRMVWDVPVFTPAKFALFAFAATAVAGITGNLSSPHERLASTEAAVLLRPVDAVGQDNGTLTSNFYLIPTPVTQSPSRTSTPPPAPMPIVHRSYPPL